VDHLYDPDEQVRAALAGHAWLASAAARSVRTALNLGNPPPPPTATSVVRSVERSRVVYYDSGPGDVL